MESQDHATNRVAQNALPNASKSSEQSCFEKEKCPCCNPKTQKPPAHHHQKRVFLCFPSSCRRPSVCVTSLKIVGPLAMRGAPKTGSPRLLVAGKQSQCNPNDLAFFFLPCFTQC
jgi:hypothetical protein